MIEETRAQTLLGPLRGEPPVDVARLADMLVRLGRLMTDFPRISEIDINPVLVPGGTPIAADALLILSDA
jgi:acetyltransferase